MPDVKNNLRALRERTGISASDLAARVGVSRQSIHAMEAGSYVPNTAVALALASALGTSVEQLFSLDETERPVPATLLGEAFEGQPLHIAEVGGRVVAVPSSPAPYYLTAADAIAGKTGRGRFGASAITICCHRYSTHRHRRMRSGSHLDQRSLCSPRRPRAGLLSNG